MKKFIYFYTILIITKLDNLFKREHTFPLRPTGISHSVCIKGNKYYQSCKCGSQNGRC